MKQITGHQPGSLRELFVLSYPLMISTFAAYLMIFVDRLFLSHYDLGALNAATNAGTFAWALTGGIGSVTAMSEVFVAQYNGALLTSSLGRPVWQMIFVSLFSLLFFIPAAFFLSPFFDQASSYFMWMMCGAPLYAAFTALAGFFVGQGQTKLLLYLAVGANLINIVLDYCFIFGVPGLFPEMGISGAGLATFLGLFFEMALLFFFFLKKKNRDLFSTHKITFHFGEMKKCLQVGVPQGIFYTLEILGWACFYWMMTMLGDEHITVSSLCQSVIILLSFFFDGLTRGVAAAAGNFIGARQFAFLSKVLKSGLYLQILFSSLLFPFLILYPVEALSFLFFSRDALPLDPSLLPILSTCMNCLYFYLFFEGVRYLLAGLLLAAGDTLFLSIAGVISAWFFFLLPVYYFVVERGNSIELAWQIAVIYSVTACLLYGARYFQGKWRSIDLIEKERDISSLID